MHGCATPPRSQREDTATTPHSPQSPSSSLSSGSQHSSVSRSTPLAMPRLLPYTLDNLSSDTATGEHNSPHPFATQTSTAAAATGSHDSQARDVVNSEAQSAASHSDNQGLTAAVDTSTSDAPTSTNRDSLMLSETLTRSPTTSSDPLSEGGHRDYYTPSSSAESFEWDTIATPCDQRDGSGMLPSFRGSSKSKGRIAEPNGDIVAAHGLISDHHQDALGDDEFEDEPPAKLWSPRKIRQLLGAEAPSPPPPARRIVSEPTSPRPWSSAESSYTQSSTTEPRTSSDQSVASGPSICVTESPRGPQLGFADTGSISDNVFGPPLGLFGAEEPMTMTPASQASVSTVTPAARTTTPLHTSTPNRNRLAVSTGTSSSSPASPPEPSPIARDRRLASLRGLVSQLDFQQPWSIIDKSEAECAEFWPVEPSTPPLPQISRLSLGTSFLTMVDDSAVASSSGVASSSSPQGTLRLPPPSGSSRSSVKSNKSSRFGRSIANLVNRWDEANMYPMPPAPSPTTGEHSTAVVAQPKGSIPESGEPTHEPVPIATPTVEVSPTPSLEVPQPPSTPAANGDAQPVRPGLHKSPSFRSAKHHHHTQQQHREPPHPPPARKETFGAQHSGYTKAMRPVTPGTPLAVADVSAPTAAAATWRATTTPEVYEQVLSGPDGAREMTRQDVMWEMCETEAAFVRACRDVLRLFAEPLRVVGGEWMFGIPDSVCQLFEELEAIADTHAALVASQEAARKASDVLEVESFMTMFANWVERLSCHEKYIVLFNPVCQLVEDKARDDQSTFGEFLRMQSTDKALGSLSLASMLLKPVQRLTKYPLFLTTLFRVTPAPHPAHQLIADLREHTEVILSKLESGKAQEDDLQKVLQLVDDLDDLPEDFELCVRGRRLVAHAQVIRIDQPELLTTTTTPSYSPAMLSPASPPTLLTRSGSIRALRHTLGSSIKSSASTARLSPSAGTPSAETPSSGDYTTVTTSSGSGSTGSLATASSQTGTSSSVDAASRPSSPVRPERPERTLRPATSYGSSLRDIASNRAPSTTATRSVSTSMPMRRKSRPELLTMLIFNDLILLAAPIEPKPGFFKSRKDRERERVRFRVLPLAEGGIGSVDDVKEVKGWGGYSRAFLVLVRAPPPAPGDMTSLATYALAPAAMVKKAQAKGSLGGPGTPGLGGAPGTPGAGNGAGAGTGGGVSFGKQLKCFEEVLDAVRCAREVVAPPA